ncbi:phosphate transport system substrate-binding protein [Paraburkholderia sp. GAS199]|uniref:phosphate ABC transporter substrate-binding protein PstS n=1 Tax=Paraburkholderia sp. GAS199 TaxID=3035126 RepID=UPI003D1CFB15
MRHVLSLSVALTGVLIAVAAHAADPAADPDSNSGAAVNLTGAGSTFAAPIYGKWAEAYQKSGGGKVDYKPVGSTEGLKRIVANEVDFAGSDAPLSDDDLAKQGLVQFPTVVGGVVPVVNIPDIKPGELTLSGQVLGDIYLGKIVNWNAPAIAALNPTLKLPDMPIAVVRRADGSGTTLIWTHYLAQANAEWKSRIGEGATVRWPRGLGGRGNEGVATYVQHVPGAIGYVAWDFTKQNHMAYTAMRNATGASIQPGPATFKAAAESADWSRSLYPFLTNEPGQQAWPVVGATFVLLHASQDGDKSARAAAILRFFDWAMTHGAQTAEALDYIPLPETVAAEVQTYLHAQLKDVPKKALAGQ